MKRLLTLAAILLSPAMLVFSGTTDAPELVAPEANAPAAKARQSPTALKYDAIQETSRRTLPARDTRSEDRVLRIEQRDRLNSVSRDVRRNNVIGAWMIRKHQDFVSDIIIRVGGKDDGLKRDLDQFLRLHTARNRFDVAGRFSLPAFVRIMEGARTLEGDFGVLKLKTGHVQGIEADSIRDPRDFGIDQENWHNGVRTNPKGGRHIEYALHTRNRHGGFVFDRKVPVKNFWLHGYFDRVNQVRGVTPLSTALNGLSYIYDLREFVHAKARLSSLLGFKFTKKLPDDLDEDEAGVGPTTYLTDEELAATTEAKAKARIKFEDGIASINLEAGEDVNVVESNTPPTELLNFLKFDVMLCMLSLDLPFNWLDPSQSNFFGGKGALQLYQRSAAHKQAGNIDFVRYWLNWTLREEIIAGRLSLPSGKTIADLPLEVFCKSVPWWDKAKELTGELIGISAGIENPQDVAQAHDSDFYENVDQTAAALEYARDKLEPLGMNLNFDRPALTPTLKDESGVDA